LQSGPDDKTDKDDGDSCSAGGNPPGTLPYLKNALQICDTGYESAVVFFHHIVSDDIRG